MIEPFEMDTKQETSREGSSAQKLDNFLNKESSSSLDFGSSDPVLAPVTSQLSCLSEVGSYVRICT